MCICNQKLLVSRQCFAFWVYLSQKVTDAELNRRLNEEYLQSNMDQLLESGRRMAIEYLLNPVDEDDVIQQIKDGDLLCHITEYGASGCTVGTHEDVEEQTCTIHYRVWMGGSAYWRWPNEFWEATTWTRITRLVFYENDTVQNPKRKVSKYRPDNFGSFLGLVKMSHVYCIFVRYVGHHVIWDKTCSTALF